MKLIEWSGRPGSKQEYKMSTTSNKPELELIELPYSERQLVIVQADDKVYASRNKESQGSHEDNADWAKYAAALGMRLFSGGWVVAAGTAAGYGIYKWYKTRESDFNILNISKSEARKLRFPPGHPREKVLYVAHPTLPPVYYTAASFHRMVFEHKFAEVIRLLMGLGANNIRVKHERGWSREFSSTICAPIPDVNVETNASCSGNKRQSLLFEAFYENNHHASSIPSDLVWYPHEPTWITVAEGRLNHGLSKFSLRIDYTEDYGINADLKVNIEKNGLTAGGEFQEHKSTTWLIEGEFSCQ